MSEMHDGAERHLFKKPQPVRVTAELYFDENLVEQAIAWGRKHKFTYERDGDMSGLLLAAGFAGALDESPDIDDSDAEAA